MKLSAANFLTHIKSLVTGGGVGSDGVTPRIDAGFLKDIHFNIADLIASSGAATLTDSTGGVVSTTLAAITAGAAYAQADATATKNAIASLAAQVNKLTANANGTATETNLRAVSVAASTTAVGTVNLTIPRDYDENTDTFTLHVLAGMSGATDTPGLSATVYRKRPGSAIATVATGVTGKLRGVTTAAALSATAQVVTFNFSRNGLLMDDALTIVLTSDAHTTDSILIHSVQPAYRSTLVAYHESVGGTRDGKDGTFLR